MEKTLGQIAHEAGEKAGGWSRKWEHLGDGQRAEWEAIAEAVAEQARKECAGVAFRHAKAHEQASEKATSDADRDLSVNMSLAADAVGQAILAASNDQGNGPRQAPLAEGPR